MNRKVLWTALVIGAALVIAPFALSLPSKASSGETMLNEFQPIMQPSQVKKTADYYNNTFTKLRPIALALNGATVKKFQGYGQGMVAVQAESKKLVPALAQGMHMTPAQVQQFLAKEFPATAQLFQSLPQITTDFGNLIGLMAPNVKTFANVPPGLDHYKPVVTTMQANVTNYEDVNSLPSFRLFTWFFVIPGILLVLLAGYALLPPRVADHLPSHHARPTPA